jgi:hypothetical protein
VAVRPAASEPALQRSERPAKGPAAGRARRPGPVIGTKAKRFGLVRFLSERKQNILIWSKEFFYCEQIVSVLGQNFWDEAKQFDLVWKLF